MPATATAAELAATMDKALDLNADVATPVPATEEEAEPTPSELKLKELRGELADEILLKDNPGRYVIFPIQHQDVSLCVRLGRNACVGCGVLGVRAKGMARTQARAQPHSRIPALCVTCMYMVTRSMA